MREPIAKIKKLIWPEPPLPKIQVQQAEIIVGSREDADKVIERLRELIKETGVATHGDLLTSVGATNLYQDDIVGWKSLDEAHAREVSSGYLIVLPRMDLIR